MTALAAALLAALAAASPRSEGATPARKAPAREGSAAANAARARAGLLPRKAPRNTRPAARARDEVRVAAVGVVTDVTLVLRYDR